MSVVAVAISMPSVSADDTTQEVRDCANRLLNQEPHAIQECIDDLAGVCRTYTGDVLILTEPVLYFSYPVVVDRVKHMYGSFIETDEANAEAGQGYIVWGAIC